MGNLEGWPARSMKQKLLMIFAQKVLVPGPGAQLRAPFRSGMRHFESALCARLSPASEGHFSAVNATLSTFSKSLL